MLNLCLSDSSGYIVFALGSKFLYDFNISYIIGKGIKRALQIRVCLSVLSTQ